MRVTMQMTGLTKPRFQAAQTPKTLYYPTQNETINFLSSNWLSQPQAISFQNLVETLQQNVGKKWFKGEKIFELYGYSTKQPNMWGAVIEALQSLQNFNILEHTEQALSGLDVFRLTPAWQVETPKTPFKARLQRWLNA